ncbi:MAG: NAD(P)-dependent alcohol dehydrogenase [Sphingobium sp.]|nr:NAD(P)-dependent alcohol dehydrogenase [Sphingobium sp.]
MKIRAAVARSPRDDFHIETLDLSDIQPDEILVRITATGLCHTDLAVRDQMLPFPLPAVLGHEGAGIVEAVGTEAEGLTPGDRVVLGFAACRNCPQCDNGQPAYCEQFTALNFGGHRPDGSTCLHSGTETISSHFFGQSSFASYAVVSARNAVKIPDDVPLEIMGPLGCGIMTGAGSVFNALHMQAGESLLVTGAGPVGLSAVMAAAAIGAGTVIISDPLASRRDMARELGATHCLHPNDGPLPDQIRAILPKGVSCVLDTSGISNVIEAGAQALATRGRLAMVGVPRSAEASISLNILHLLSLGAQICGVTEGNADPKSFLPYLIDLYRAGKFPFDRMIKHYPLDQINQAIADQHDGKCVKAVLNM